MRGGRVGRSDEEYQELVSRPGRKARKAEKHRPEGMFWWVESVQQESWEWEQGSGDWPTPLLLEMATSQNLSQGTSFDSLLEERGVYFIQGICH